MPVELYITYVIAAAVLIAAPGPSLMVVVSHALAQGLRRSWFTIAGQAVSHAMFISIVTLGLAPLLAAAAGVFVWLKWVGVVFLAAMGVRLWMARPPAPHTRAPLAQASGFSLFLQGFAVNTTNPKALVFYAAFFPPFLVPNLSPAFQLLLLGATFIGIFLAVSFFYALAAAHTGSLLRGPAQVRLQNKIAGGLLVAVGLGLAFIKAY